MFKRKFFEFLPTQSDGLALRIHHTIEENQQQRRLIFITATFSDKGDLLACCDHRDNLFIFDLLNFSYWKLPNKGGFPLSFFPKTNDLYVVRNDSQLEIDCIDITCGETKSNLIGHQLKPSHMIISDDEITAITYRSTEAIMWELKKHTKLFILNLNNQSVTHIKFSPVSNYIVASFNNRRIQIWNKSYLEQVKNFPEKLFYDVTCFAFTLNGRMMVTAGKSSKITIANTDSWSIRQVSIDKEIRAVKNIAFLSYGFDGGANRFLLIFSNDCKMYYYDILKMHTLHVLVPECSCFKSFVINFNGKYLSCVLKSGEINLYKNSSILDSYVDFQLKSKEKNIIKTSDKKNTKIITESTHEMTNSLEKNRLKKILLHFGEYPSKYRTTIWSSLLNIPFNRNAYINLIGKPLHSSCSIIENRYSLQKTIYTKHLKRLMSCLYYWCPILEKFDFVVEFVFPFMKILYGDPLQCFEIVITILKNYCQSWFKFAPLIPIDILAVIENILANNDKVLLKHYMKCDITSETYGWTLLKTGFSEVLTTSEWLMLWDHIISNCPIFFLFSVISYNIINRNALLDLTEIQDFQAFFSKQNAMSMKLLLKLTYKLLNTSDNSSQHLRKFTALPKGECYPQYGYHSLFDEFYTS